MGGEGCPVDAPNGNVARPVNICTCPHTSELAGRAMANDNDTIAYLQYAARELPVSLSCLDNVLTPTQVPRFGKPYDIRGGNTKTIRNIAFSCDGKKAATGTEYKGIRIWNATQPVRRCARPAAEYRGKAKGTQAKQAQMEAAGSYSLPRNVDSSPHNGHVGKSIRAAGTGKEGPEN